MNDEIKEILDYLKKNKEFFNKQDGYLSFSYKYCDKLLDYITNLREENEDLKDRLKVMEHFKNSLLEENEKAIEYIKTRVDSSKASKYELLSILNGGDKDEKIINE